MKMLHQLREIHKWLDKVRTWWTNRNIPQEIAETVLQQSKKVAKAASIYWKHCTDIDIKKLVTMALTHDFAEYKEKDYIPWEITKEEKHRREKVVMMELKESMGEKGEQLFNIWMEHEQWETKESQIVHQLDKLDAAIQAMEYEKLWHDSVKEFYPYTLWKLTDPVLMQILEFLLKKEYLEINTYDQYFLLLEYNWDEELFKERIEILLQRKITQN
jgi:putative hydrolase of HD superfamily